MLQLKHVTPEGATEAALEQVVIYHPRTGQPTGMVVWVEIATQQALYDLARKCRRHEVDPGTKQMQQRIDGVKLQQLAMARYVKRWEGVTGKDGTPLPCVPAVMNALPEWVADQITEGLKGIPPADEPDAEDVRDASFRESS